MIVLQSCAAIAALCCSNSLESCGRLAVDNTPGELPRYPRTLKGHWKEVNGLERAPSWSGQSVFIRLSAEAFTKADVHPRLKSLFTNWAPASPNRESTVGFPKSTVDLRSQPLIWVEERPASAFLPGLRYSFCPITTRQWRRANRMQTDTGQNINRPTIDLGCDAAPALSLGICRNGFKLMP